MMNVLITSRNKPSVKKVMGMVSTIRIGFSTALRKEMAIAASNALPKLLTCTPGTMNAAKMITIAETNIFRIKFTVKSFLKDT